MRPFDGQLKQYSADKHFFSVWISCCCTITPACIGMNDLDEAHQSQTSHMESLKRRTFTYEKVFLQYCIDTEIYWKVFSGWSLVSWDENWVRLLNNQCFVRFDTLDIEILITVSFLCIWSYSAHVFPMMAHTHPVSPQCICVLSLGETFSL